MLRPIAQYTGIALIVMGVVGFLLNAGMGEDPLFGVFNIDYVENAIRLVCGGLLAYAGFMAGESGGGRVVVGLVGVVLVALGVVGFVSTDLWELMATDYSPLDNLIHLVVGGLALAAAWMARSAPEQSGQIAGA